MNMAQKNCENCGKEFFCRAYKVKRARFCSRKCLGFVVSTKIQRDLHEKWNKETFEETIASMKILYEKHVRKSDIGCWRWNGTTRSIGYGNFMFRKKQIAAHRASYMIHNLKPIPLGMCVLHVCDNPPCTNPEHLVLGTSLENNHDMLIKGRHPQAKLNPELVREIRQLLGQGVMSKDIMNKYRLSAMTVHKLKTGKTWKDII